MAAIGRIGVRSAGNAVSQDFDQGTAPQSGREGR
jgi:hypothetical protein